MKKNAVSSITKRLVIAAAGSLLLVAASPALPAAKLSEVTRFGSNPGNLRMFKYIPARLGANRPLVVALHGCTQSAAEYDDETGWTKFADLWGFALLLPEQRRENQLIGCFSWYELADTARDGGEVLSIKQMVDQMQIDHAIDPARVYVTGLSAGGAMTAAMLATYPEVFAGGAVIAGLPYRCARDQFEAQSVCMRGRKNLPPSGWGNLVRAATRHRGPWPRVSIWHGSADTTVVPVNATELVEQWTDVHGIDQVPDGEDTVGRHAHKLYKDKSGTALVETYAIAGMGHGTPVDPGAAEKQCGIVGPFIVDADICSSFHIAKFWGLDRAGDDSLKKQLLNRIERIQREVSELRSIVEQMR